MDALIIIFGLAEAVMGWLQLLGLTAPGHSLYVATGTFYNPGPFCGFLAVIAPVALYNVLFKNRKVLYWLSLAYLLLALGLMPALMGRTGWIAALLGCGVVVVKRYSPMFPKFSGKKVWITVLAGSLLGLAVLGLLYFIKPESAQGRLLMWIVAAKAMAAHPFGVGWDMVAGAFGEAQEAYFSMHPDSPFAMVAGAPEYVFNEFLQTGIAFGILGFLLFTGLIVACGVAAWRTRAYGLCGAIIAFAAVCFSSYPLQFSEFYVLAALIAVAIVFRSGLSTWGKVSITATIIAGTVFPVVNIEGRKSGMQEWEKVGRTLRYRLNDKDISRCDSLMVSMDWSPKFLFGYGKALRDNGFYEKSNEVLMRGMEVSSDPMFLNLIGRNHEDKGDFGDAERYYRKSIRRLPNRLYPRYLLAKLYAAAKGADSQEFKEAYRQAMSMRPKVESPATRQMRKELQNMKK